MGLSYCPAAVDDDGSVAFRLLQVYWDTPTHLFFRHKLT